MEEMNQEICISFEATPGTIKSDVLDKLRDYVERTSTKYRELVVTPENLKDAKGDLAMLRKSYDELETERKRVKALWQAPYLAWEEKYKAAVSWLTEAISSVDRQIKAFEASEKTRLASEVRQEIWSEARGMDVRVVKFMELYPAVFGWVNRKEYYNKSYSSNRRTLEIRDALLQISRDLEVIGEDEMLQALYVECGNLSMAQIKRKEHEEKAQKLAAEKKAAEEERKKAKELQIPAETSAPAPEPPREEYRPRYTYEELTIPQVDENHLGEDDLKKARLKRTFVGPKYKLKTLMYVAEDLGIELIKEEN